MQTFLNGKVTLHAGDCLDVIKTLADDSIDACVTDPPYALVSIVKRFGKSNMETSAAEQQPNRGAQYKRLSKGFMGKEWDTGDVAFAVEFWAEMMRVLKPGAHVAAFSGTRTYHRLACAIEDAGFEIRDQLAWTYGSGFPKSHNQGEGRGTALKPAWEPICLARAPLSESTVAKNLLRWGTGAINIDACRVGTDDKLGGGMVSMGRPKASEGWDRPWMHDAEITERKKGESAAKVAVAESLGRWPANVVHDGSPEVLAAFPDSEDSAARFFYSAKADADDRLGSKHPTVKPVDLMQWLCRLITPPAGVILDPFAGTGTAGAAAWLGGYRSVLIEREPEYQADIARRMKLMLAGPDERAREAIKAKHADRPVDSGPLFAILANDNAPKIRKQAS